MKITLEQLEKLGACSEGKQWFLKKKLKTLKAIVPALLEDGYFGWSNWLMVRLMTRPQRIKFSIFCAELVLENFERKFPGDDRPRKAIQAAKDFLAGKIDARAAYSAASAAYSAASAVRAAYSAARKKTEKKIAVYGLKLLGVK